MSWLRHLTLAAVALCFAVVVFGAYVRLSDAGLGCPDWPGCYGKLTVPAAMADADAQQRHPGRPLEAAKAWKEMIHRYLASGLGLLIVGVALLARRLRFEGAPRRLPWFLVGLVIFQGVLGMWTVTWQLKPLAVTAHLLGGMMTLALLTWMWLSLRQSAAVPADGGSERLYRSERHAMLSMQADEGKTLRGSPLLRLLAAATLLALALQIFLGGWTSSNYAALACPDFPTCHGSWWPAMDREEAFTLWRGLGVNYEHGVLDNRARVTIHFSHRLGALLVSALALALAALLWARGKRGFAIAVAGALALQVGIGIAIVKMQLPLLLADLHNAGAAVLLLTLIVLTHSLWTAARTD